MQQLDNWGYKELKQLLKPVSPPTMVVNRKVLERNTMRLVETARDTGKSLRVASKSVRVPWILEKIRYWAGDTFGGLMTYSPRETAFLHDRGFNDFLIAYPRVNRSALEQVLEVHRTGATVRMMVDEPEHLHVIDSLYREHSRDLDPLPVCIDLDVSYRPGNLTHLGVRRSPIRDLEHFKKFHRTVKSSASVSFAGVMGYEAQQAGVPDDSPFHPVKNYFIRGMKQLSRQRVLQKRRSVNNYLRDAEPANFLFNAGGTGSIQASVQEDWITEVTAGSGFLQSHLFDYYRTNHNEPAFCFALPVTRQPEDAIVTCQSGGFIASGPIGPEKTPRPFLPEDVSTLNREGYGEVQTPLRVPEDVTLDVGDPVFFRPAKAGEIAERFSEYLIQNDGNLLERAKTYRGHGQCFY